MVLSMDGNRCRCRMLGVLLTIGTLGGLHTCRRENTGLSHDKIPKCCMSGQAY